MDNFDYFSDDEESEWLTNIDPSLLDKSNEEKQLDDDEISLFIGENTAQIPFPVAYFCYALSY